VLHHNAIPVFVDIDYDTMNIDPARIEAALSERTRAIIAVHLHGLPASMDPILEIALRHGLKVIEDCCQAHGAEYKGTRVGRLADCGAFSFNQNKCLCSGEGGMFVTDNEEILQRARMVWSFGETRTPAKDRDYHAYALGWMYRNNDLTAAFGRAQLAKLDAYLETAARNARILAAGVRDIPGLQPPIVPEGHKTNWYNFTCHVDGAAYGYQGPPARFRNAVMKALQAEGVPVEVWQDFILPEMTVFQAQNAYGQGSPWNYGRRLSYDPALFPVARKHCETHFGMTVPLRAPNDELVAQHVGAGIRKVFERIGDLDIDALGAETGA
ncbi:MAG TPA: DegT/DnrJ/EryC1/StrS family aminotransferase, partial [Candidatus Hydrogenedentes bacterium]|nr:DegT/DnrJ/EryC1/StrS family aminotransferase [Candidatus Hydrogenedentota bacterium]